MLNIHTIIKLVMSVVVSDFESTDKSFMVKTIILSVKLESRLN